MLLLQAAQAQLAAAHEQLAKSTKTLTDSRAEHASAMALAEETQASLQAAVAQVRTIALL